MKVSVIIVNYNVKYFLEVCLDSVLRAAEGMAVEVIVVDNNSSDGSCAMVRERFPQVKLLENKENAGFSRANNQGVAIARGQYILFLNPDTVMPEDFLQQTVAFMDAQPKAGALGPRLIDGKGRFAPDGKKGFPTLSVALFKATGLNKLFPRSPYFNSYYAVHVGELEQASVEVLSGCCMLVRRSVLDVIGNAFDEDYFMYCEDVDLCYRIRQAGYENIYFPQATLVHYKGESTRKATLSYVRIFNEALATFVRKHYSKGQARFFVLFLQLGIALRAALGVARQVLRVLRLPLLDALILLATLWFMKEFWVLQVMNINPIPLNLVYATFPVYVGLWVASLYFNGAYDQPYRALRVVRGMLLGTVLILAYYGLLQAGMRYSRAIIVFSGLTGTVLMLGIHELLYRLGIFKFIPYDELPRKAVIVATEKHYTETALRLQRVHYAPMLEGRVSPAGPESHTLGALPRMKELLFTAGIDEVIFCVNGLSYQSILEQMQHCGGRYDYKIHLPGSNSFVGSNSSHSAGDLYTMDHRYNLSSFAQQRNKRVIDMGLAVLLLLSLPLGIWGVRNKGGLLRNCLQVLSGRCSWVGYSMPAAAGAMPALKPGILPPYFIMEGFKPAPELARKLDQDYARDYTPGTDLILVKKNFRFLGDFLKKDFAEKES